uniref:zinc finger and SCAN domain-containing protein 21-like n=1 Tax=Doryrhamphus excisus TaxID=161450 RepID=UPI0025ADD086|nr:zinc finger and SCAN domain-containing protein 21-like [Doryrhamphus excisus]
MCKIQMLRALVNHRLSAAVEEIFAVLERTIAEYEEDLRRTKAENERQRQLLDDVYKNCQIGLQGAGISADHLPSEQQEWNSRMGQKEPQFPHIKEEKEKPQLPCIKEEEDAYSINQEGEHLEGLEEFPVIGVPVKSEDDEYKGQSEERREVEPPSSSSLQHMTTEADGGSQADSLFAPRSDSDDITSHSPDTDDEADMTCHTASTRWKCSQCDKTFVNKGNLNRHTKQHTGEKPFICSVCGKRFSRHSNLKVHTKMHTGEKAFPCTVCGKRFRQKGDLITHTRVHTGEKPFSCSICGTTFTQNAHLKAHARTHAVGKPFLCMVCGKKFNHIGALNRHTITHTGEKTYLAHCVV